MAFEKTIPANENPIGTDPLTVHVREGQFERQPAQSYASVRYNGYASAAAYDSGKREIAQFPGVAFGRNPTQERFDEKTGQIAEPARPAWEDIRAAFEAEFAYVDAIWHELVRRFDPALVDASVVAPMPDPAITAEIQQRLDAAGITGFVPQS